MSPDHPERVAAWLSEVFGGPPFYTERYGGYRYVSQHIGKQIAPEQPRAVVTYMLQSAEDAGLPSDAEFRAAFVAYIEWGSRIAMENSGAGSSHRLICRCRDGLSTVNHSIKGFPISFGIGN